MKAIASVAVAILAACAMAFAGGPGIESARIESKGGKRTYYYYVPHAAATATAAPVLLLLHGSGHNGRLLVEHWKDLAEKEGIILIGPDAANPVSWSTKNDPPAFLRDVIDDVARKCPVDMGRVYIFGHSAGAKFGLIMAMAESRYFAAAAVHAGLIPPQVQHLITDAERKIPVAIWSGTSDRSVSFDEARATADALKGSDFPVDFNAMQGHDHNYYAVSGDVNRAAWQFLKDKRIEKPEFKEYN